MQQHDFDALIHVKEQRLNMLEREEMVSKYKFFSPPYYRNHENAKFEQRAQNFEPPIHYMVK